VAKQKGRKGRWQKDGRKGRRREEKKKKKRRREEKKRKKRKARTNDGNGSPSTALVITDLLYNLKSLGPLSAGALSTVPLVDLEAGIEDEDVTLVQGLVGELDLGNTDVALALDVEEPLLKGVAVNLLEARVNTAGEVTETAEGLEEVLELLGLVGLNLAVLNGGATEGVIELNGLVGGHSHLVLGSLRAEPEVDVPLEGAGGLLSLRLPNNDNNNK